MPEILNNDFDTLNLNVRFISETDYRFRQILPYSEIKPVLIRASRIAGNCIAQVGGHSYSPLTVPFINFDVYRGFLTRKFGHVIPI